jgi:acyl transferase domain-containing protein
MAPQEPIAIIGIGLRVSGADSPESFLGLLRRAAPRIGRLENVHAADWRALGIPPRELRHVDPQHRLLLEVAREAIEDAGLTKPRLAETRAAVVCGLIWDDYLRQLEREGKTDGYSVLGNVGSFAANRISFHLDLKGPSVTLNAACASGLVAVHDACRILRAGEAGIALAGACELMLSPETDRMMEGLGVLSPTGRCLPLDARADGFVRGEGAGIVVLKPLSKVEPSERVYAVIAGSAVNHNGRNEWIMASSETALREVVADACSAAGIAPDDLSYVELHAAGGPKGDLAEARSLPPGRRIGSVKANLGHLGAASGIVSLIKVALSLDAREWLPTPVEQPRPDIDHSPVLAAEPFSGLPYAGVTATSLSGTNAHVVLRAVDHTPKSDLQSAIQALLELPEPPSVHATFFELGLNSLSITELSRQFDIPPSDFFEYPTIAKLAARAPAAPAPTAAPASDTAIAVIGIGCRFPGGADTPGRFWNLIRDGRDAFGPVPAGRDVPIPRGAFLDQVDGFDAAFFRMSPREAAQTDPQQRLFLEVAWEALENAAIDPTRLAGTRTGVYAGAFAHDYANLKGPVDAYHFTGVDIAFNANRVSFALGLQGPSLTVDTACSSSLVALHLATRALRQGECDLALAGGVSLMLSPEISRFLESAGTLSPTGACRAFHPDADGMVRGEGCGVVVLKRLADAQAAGDRILAVIRGTAVNHGGASGGLTVPNPAAQAQLYRAALSDAGVSATEVIYVEAHGTGTKLGDPIEMSGISAVYPSTVEVGTVKTNFGHTDAAAGVAGFIKAVLMSRETLKEGKLAVSSFGLGGTNAHVIIERAPVNPRGSGTGPCLLPLSARSPEALEELLRSYPPADPDVCWTAARSRAGLSYRTALIGGIPGVVRQAVERSEWGTVFVFPGQGGQWHGMGHKLGAENALFSAKIAEIDAILHRLGGKNALDFAPEDLSATSIVQPAIFAIQVGLAAVWESMGVFPHAVIGHSMGEIAAAHVAGCLDLKDAVTVVYERSRILEAASGTGRMLAAALSPAEAEELVAPFRDVLSVGVVNGPRSVVLSGAIEKVIETLQERGIFHRELPVRYASHCPQMERFRAPVREALRGIRPHDGKVAFHSTILGRTVRGTELDAEYWAANFRESVLFAPAAIELAKAGAAAFIELSPNPTLDAALAACLEEAGSDAVAVSSMRRDEPEQPALLEAVGQLYCAGYPVDFTKVNPPGRLVDLPNYPWQRKRYWIAEQKEVPRLERIASPLPQEQYQITVSRTSPEYLSGHGLRREVYFPASAMIEMAWTARPEAIRDLKFEAPLLLDDNPTSVQLTIDGGRFSIHSSRDGGNWERHASGEYGGKVTHEVRAEVATAVADFYEGLERRGYRYDGAFRAIRRIERGTDSAIAEIAMPEGEHLFHPAALDACLHAALALASDGLLMPVGAERAEFVRSPEGDLQSFVQRRGQVFDVEVHDARGVCARVEGLALKAIGGDRPAWQDWCYRTRWIPALPPSMKPRGRMRIVGEAAGLRQFLGDRGHACVEDGAADHVLYFADGDDFEQICGEALRLAQSLETPRLWLITRGAQALAEEPVQAGQAGLWGLGRVIAREMPSLACTMVDLDPESDDWRELWRELGSEPGESQVLLRRGKRYVSRLEPVAFGTACPFRIGIDRYGQLDGLQPKPLEIPRPGKGEVLIRTEVVPVNFRDALNALGMLPDYAAELGIRSAAAMPFGFECGGTIAAVGEGVTEFASGDRVIAGPITGALATHVIADARRVIKGPSELACLPVVHMTASYALETLAKLRPSDRVLIHAAAGGVGMAAVQLAQRIGAEIYCTAHPDKWPALQAMGVTRLWSSRDVEFARETSGMDVVLNSLGGPAIEASLRACATGARFIEIGKKDIWPAERVAAMRPDVEYHAFTFSEVADEQPELVERLLREMATRPVRMPVTRFRADEIPAAFRYLAQARHTGKVVIEMPRAAGIAVRPDATYWITGGRGALGMEVARWLVERGAGRVILSGRSKAAGPGGRIEYRQCDVSSAEEVRALLASENVRGIIHAAGVIDDATIAAQTPERLRRVWAPKGIAARNVIEAAAGKELDFLVFFSSTAAVLGPPGQANYAAANAAMDAMAHNAGALSIQWGPWAEAGLAASLSEQHRNRLATSGMDFMASRACLAAMDALFSTGLRAAVVAPVNWERYVAGLPPGCPTSPFERLTRARVAPQRNILGELEAAPAKDRRALLESFVRDQIARSLGLADGSGIGARQRLFDLGFDSLMAVELRTRLAATLKKPLRRTLVFDYPRLDALIEHLAGTLGIEEEVPEEELAAMLDDRLAAAARYLGEAL